MFRKLNKLSCLKINKLPRNISKDKSELLIKKSLKNAKIRNLEKGKFNEIEKMIYRIYLNDKRLENAMEEYSVIFEEAFWTTERPAEFILTEFGRSLKEVGFSEEILCLALESLVKVQRSRPEASFGHDLGVSTKY